MLKSKDIVKHLIPEILTFYTNFNHAHSQSVIFCTVNKEHSLYRNTDKVFKFKKFNNWFGNRDAIFTQSLFNALKFIKINDNQVEPLQMKKLLADKNNSYFYFSYICNNEDIKVLLKDLYTYLIGY